MANKEKSILITQIVVKENIIYGIGSDQKMYRWRPWDNGFWEEDSYSASNQHTTVSGDPDLGDFF